MARLTVAVVAGVDAAFESLHLCKLGQHLGEGAAALVRRRARALLHAVVPLRKLQRQIPEGLHCVGLVLAGQTRHLRRNNSRVCHGGGRGCSFGKIFLPRRILQLKSLSADKVRIISG